MPKGLLKILKSVIQRHHPKSPPPPSPPPLNDCLGMDPGGYEYKAWKVGVHG